MLTGSPDNCNRTTNTELQRMWASVSELATSRASNAVSGRAGEL